MTRKAITSNRFARPEPSRKQQPTVLVICEDSKSSLEYLKAAARHFRAYAKLEVAHVGSAPQTIVAKALQRAKHFEEIYCVIDRDTHELFDQAINHAKAESKITMIVSYPCFEFWLLLHFKKTRKPYATTGNKSPADAVLVDLKKTDTLRQYTKGNALDLFSLLLPKLRVAFTNAAWSNAAAFEENNPNPSTQIDTLLHRLDKLGS